MKLREAALDFLSQKRIAVVGVSHDSDEAANFVLRKLRDGGHEVVPVNPHMDEAEGLPCYPHLHAIPDGVDAAVVFTPPSASADIVRECAALGITRVWLHRALGTGSFSEDAVKVAHAEGITLIAGGCPAMFCENADIAHRCMRWILDVAGKLPREVEAPVR